MREETELERALEVAYCAGAEEAERLNREWEAVDTRADDAWGEPRLPVTQP